MKNMYIKNYTGRATPSYMVNFNGFELYFSYETLIAFRYNGKTEVIKNYWGSTTGRHLNDIDGGEKDFRLSEEDFNAALDEAFDEFLTKQRAERLSNLFR